MKKLLAAVLVCVFCINHGASASPHQTGGPHKLANLPPQAGIDLLDYVYACLAEGGIVFEFKRKI